MKVHFLGYVSLKYVYVCVCVCVCVCVGVVFKLRNQEFLSEQPVVLSC